MSKLNDLAKVAEAVIQKAESDNPPNMQILNMQLKAVRAANESYRIHLQYKIAESKGVDSK